MSGKRRCNINENNRRDRGPGREAGVCKSPGVQSRWNEEPCE